MPYFFDPNLDKENNPYGANPQIASASGNTENSGDGAGSSGQKKSNPTGSGFQNLDKYLQNNNADQFGGQVVGKVQGDIDQAKTDQSKASSAYAQQVQGANYVPTSDEVNSAIANPDQADKTKFQGWEHQTYGGPHSLAETQDLNNQYFGGVQKAVTNAGLLGSQGGRYTLLDSYFGRPTYSAGEKGVDNLLFQQSGQGAHTQDLQSQAAQLQAAGSQEMLKDQNLAAQRAGQVEGSANSVRQAIGVDKEGKVITGAGAGAIGKQYQIIDDATAAANAARTGAGSQFQNDLKNGTLNSSDLTNSGLKGDQNIYDIDLNDPRYFQAGGALTKEQVMTPEQQKYLQALTELSGATDTYAQNPLHSRGDDYKFNLGALGNDINQKQQQYETDWNTPTVQRPGETPTSMAQLQQFVTNIANAQAKLGRMTPDSWGGALGDQARDYLNRIGQFNDAHKINRTVSNSAYPYQSDPNYKLPPTVTSIEGKTGGPGPQIPVSPSQSAASGDVPVSSDNSSPATEVVNTISKPKTNIDYGLPSDINNATGTFAGGTSIEMPQQTVQDQAKYTKDWNTPQTYVPGQPPMTMAQIQAAVNDIASGYGNQAPDPQETDGQLYYQYADIIKQFQDSHAKNPVTATPAPTVTSIAGKGPIYQKESVSQNSGPLDNYLNNQPLAAPVGRSSGRNINYR